MAPTIELSWWWAVLILILLDDGDFIWILMLCAFLFGLVGEVVVT